VEMLIIACARLDSAAIPPVRDRMDALLAAHKSIVGLT
jgi:hypothetical protein